MSSGWLRRSSPLVATLLLLSSLWQLPHRWQDDDLCAPLPAEAHDESKHVFTTPESAPHEDHCAVCHWTRWLKPLFTAAPTAVSPNGGGATLAPKTADIVRAPGTDRLPPRAPPASA